MRNLTFRSFVLSIINNKISLYKYKQNDMTYLANGDDMSAQIMHDEAEQQSNQPGAHATVRRIVGEFHALSAKPAKKQQPKMMRE